MNNERYRQALGTARPLIAMIHLEPLPGSPRYGGSVDAIVERALAEAATYAEAGVDALMLENMHDIPYLKGAVGPETVAAATAAATAIKRAYSGPCGLQLLAGANREALAVALAAGLDFIRAEGFVFAHVADEGVIESCAGDLLRYRRTIGADRVLVLADIKKKHSAHALTADVSIDETAHAAEFFLADGVIVTGTATGRAAAVAEVTSVQAAVRIPVLVGSGLTPDNLADYYEAADGFIVGSFFKEKGDWRNPIAPARLGRFMDALRQLRGQ